VHPGYQFRYANEIRCDGWACSRGMDVELSRIPSPNADRVYAEHQSKELDLILARGNNHNADAPEHQR
jgi:hypothetical protein